MIPLRTCACACAITLALALVTSARAEVGPVGNEFVVNTYTTGYQGVAKVAVDGSGGFVVVWQSGYTFSNGPDGSYSSIGGRRFAAGGAPQGNEFVVNSYTQGPQRFAAVAK